jgi:predicted DNA binding protein
MLAIQFSVYHHGCPATELTERFPDVSAKVLSTNVYDKKAAVVMWAGSARGKETGRFLRFWKDHAAVNTFRVSARKAHEAVFDVRMTSGTRWVTGIVVEHEGIFSTPVPVRNGLETWSVILPDRRLARSLVSELDTVGTVNVHKIKTLDIGRLLTSAPMTQPDLTPRQMQVLREAFEAGYFESPRRIGSRELAARIGLAQATILEHLRKAQAKLTEAALRNV